MAAAIMPPHPAPSRPRPALPSRNSATQHTHSTPAVASIIGGTHRGPRNNHTIEKDGSLGFHGLPINDDPMGADLLEWALRIRPRSGGRHVSSQSSLPSVMSLGRASSNPFVGDISQRVLTEQEPSRDPCVLASLTHAAAPCIASTIDTRRRNASQVQRPMIGPSSSYGGMTQTMDSRLAPSPAQSSVTRERINVDLCCFSKAFNGMTWIIRESEQGNGANFIIGFKLDSGRQVLRPIHIPNGHINKATLEPYLPRMTDREFWELHRIPPDTLRDFLSVSIAQAQRAFSQKKFKQRQRPLSAGEAHNMPAFMVSGAPPGPLSPASLRSSITGQTPQPTVALSGSYREIQPSIISRATPSSAHGPAIDRSNEFPEHESTLTLNKRPWLLKTTRQENGTLVKIEYELSPRGVWISRTIFLPASQVGEERVATLLPGKNDQDFWQPLSGLGGKRLGDALVKWIVRAQQESRIADQQSAGQRQQPPSPEYELASIGGIYLKVSTSNGQTFEVGWSHLKAGQYTTCTFTLEERLLKRSDILGKLPSDGNTNFWPTQVFLYNGIDIRKDAARLLANSIFRLRQKKYGLSV